MSSTIDFDSLIKKECKTCEKPCLVFPHHEGDVECENCYLTKLELEKMKKHANRGSSFDDFLEEEGISAEVVARAAKKPTSISWNNR